MGLLTLHERQHFTVVLILVGMSYSYLETRVIIKIYANFWQIFMGMKQNNFFFEKEIKMADSQKLSFQLRQFPILNIFHENFRDWSLG